MTKKYKFPNIDDVMNGASDQHTAEWFGNDSLEKYKESLKTMPNDWVWRDKKITYHINSHGYRCDKNFNEVDWESSIVVLGCSKVFGIGVDNENTLSGHIHHLTGIPTVNLGIPGASVMRIWSLLTDLLNSGIKPKAVVIVWTDPSRFLEILPNKQLKSWTASHLNSIDERTLPYAWISHEYQGIGFANRAINSSRVMCKDIPYFDYSWFTVPDIDITNIKSLYDVDDARDCIHPGIGTLRKWAEHIVNDMTVAKSFKNNV